MNGAIHCFGNNTHAYVEENDLFYFFYKEGYITFSIRADIAESLGYTKLEKMDYRKI
ncbi:MAG: hypothetical protein K0S63_795 [Gammaproteobacteria bacterium]|jgi:hypothetical protein|nr:hypothetical protein [Gammaproteobacteria bacterium]